MEVTYHDVKKDAAAMRRFLELSGGDRRVPLIVEKSHIDQIVSILGDAIKKVA